MFIIGHRGARGIAPENSISSFDAALAHSVDYIEFDVRFTKDKQLVVIHDKHTKRIAFVKKYIRQLTLKEVRAIATRDGTPIPTFEEVLAHLHGKAKINIEIKSRGAAQATYDTIKLFIDKKGFSYDSFFVSSFYLGELKKLRSIDSQIRLALLQKRFPLRFLTVPMGLQLFGIGSNYRILSPIVVEIAKKFGFFVYAYTVNSPQQAKRLESWGVQGICTDRPDLFHK